jgi:hypothetical protein
VENAPQFTSGGISGEKMRAKRRTLRAYLVEPFQQIRFGLHVAMVSVGTTLLLAYLFIRSQREQYQQVIDIFEVTETTDLITNDVFLRNAFLIGAALLGTMAVMMFVVIRRTHKMYGPMVSILRFVGELTRGNYAVRIHIRERDDFQGLVQKLNALAETLHIKHGSEKFSLDESNGSGLDALDARLRDLEEGLVVVSEPPKSNSDKTGS